MHPAVRRLGLGGGCVILVIADEDTGAAVQHLAAGLVDLHLDAGAGRADGVGANIRIGLQAEIDRAFGLAVKLLEVDAERPEEIEDRSEEHTSELQSLMRSSYAVFCLKKKKNNNNM